MSDKRDSLIRELVADLKDHQQRMYALERWFVLSGLGFPEAPEVPMRFPTPLMNAEKLGYG